MIKKLLSLSTLTAIIFSTNAQTITADFENLILTKNSYWASGVNATDTSFVSGDASFHNTNDGWWSKGWAYSNVKDSTTEGYTNQYAAFPESGANNSSNYAIGRNNAKVVLLNESKGSLVQGVYITNSTYATLSMQNGDMFAKKFGGVSGNDEDFFLLTIKKYYNGVLSTDSINFYLADFRFEDNSEDYIVKDWTYVNLKSLGIADSLVFTLTSSDVGGFGMNTPAYFAIDELITNASSQFAPGVGEEGTTAIYKDSSAFINWATSCSVNRGYLKIDEPELGQASAGEPNFATGKSGENGIVSLGDGGEAILEFESSITNGDGWDFAVFENSFNNTFLELAFVEVSSDGINFYRFPATSNTQTQTQVGSFDSTNPTKINNLAGKYKGLYGTPFDLDELKDEIGLDVTKITHVKIIDVVGIIDEDFASYDSKKNIVNDPWPTDFASGGFDLDAVGVIHQVPTSVNSVEQISLNIYPNPASDYITIDYNPDITINKISIINLSGQTVFNQPLNNSNLIEVSNLKSGYYIINIETNKGVIIKKFSKI
jgi:hypothetical protein